MSNQNYQYAFNKPSLSIQLPAICIRHFVFFALPPIRRHFIAASRFTRRVDNVKCLYVYVFMKSIVTIKYYVGNVLNGVLSGKFYFSVR